MQAPKQTRCAPKLVLALVVAIVGSSWPCFSEEPIYTDEFFAMNNHQLAEVQAPLFVVNEADERVGDNLMARAAAATSSAAETQYQPGIETPRGYRGSSLFEPQQGAFFKTMGVGMVVAAAGDFATTELGVRTPGIVEMNPLQRNRGVRIATHVAVPAFLYWATERARKSGNDKLALLIRIGASVAYSYAAMHNARTLSSYP